MLRAQLVELGGGAYGHDENQQVSGPGSGLRGTRHSLVLGFYRKVSCAKSPGGFQPNSVLLSQPFNLCHINCINVSR